MRSIPVAILWEIFRRGRWLMLAAMLGAVSLPVYVLTALRLEGLVDTQDPSHILIHILFVQGSAVCLAAGVFHTLGSPVRLYHYPISSTTLVSCQLIPLGLLVFLQSALTSAAVNLLTGSTWPIWGPAAVAGVAVIAIQAILWLTEKTWWMLPGLTGGATFLGVWFRTRYGKFSTLPTHYWETIRPIEAATLALVTLVSFGIAYVGASRARRGDSLPPLGLWAWIERWLELTPDDSRPLGSPVKAMLWHEWITKGRAMPAGTLIVGVFCFGLWLFSNRQIDELFEGTVLGGGFLSGLAMAFALVMGNLGTSDSSLEMGQFMATRPVTNSQLASVVLRTIARSVVTSWLVWIAAVLLVALLAWATGHQPWGRLNDLQWWFAPVTLLGPWIIVATGASAGMTGRSRILTLSLVVTFAMILAATVLARFVLTQEQRQLLTAGIMIAGGIVALVGTAILYFLASRRSLIGGQTVIAALVIWLALVTATVMDKVFDPTRPLTVTGLAIGLCALTVAPVAAAPLAIGLNRTR